MKSVLLACCALLATFHTTSAAAQSSPSVPPGSARSVTTAERSASEIAKGVYVIRHRDSPDTNPQGNTTVIVGDREALVVDSGYLPSSTREDIAQIRRWTALPVRYLVNTHWHPDHVRGNALYADAFPGLAIIAHTSTPELEEAYDVPNRERYGKRLASMEDQLRRGVGTDGKKLGDEARRTLTRQVEARRAVLQEFGSYVPRYANVTVPGEVTIDLGGRSVRLWHPGRGHSSGDLVLYLPRERILVAGDLVASPVPYFFAGYPYEQIPVLEELAAMDVDVLVPGHGEVMRDKAYLRRTIDLMRDVRDQVVAAVRRMGSLSAKLEDVRKTVSLGAYEAEFAGADEESREFFRESMDGLVRLLFEQIPK
ncbi:MAG TPA: MBL fold metallo-hydrolase [Candidatus Eisenbacteria bacterium]|nr:MBL fold metallo-hydrolase [Candidatus Eisenbacteria bacterium]